MSALTFGSRVRYLFVALLVSGLASCGSSGSSSGDGGPSGAGTSSGVSGSKRLDALNADEKAKLCDFQAAHFGGYGKSIDCGGGTTLDADANQSECISNWPTTCAMTVAQAEKCASESTCTNLIPPSCAPLFQCQ